MFSEFAKTLFVPDMYHVTAMCQAFVSGCRNRTVDKKRYCSSLHVGDS